VSAFDQRPSRDDLPRFYVPAVTRLSACSSNRAGGPQTVSEVAGCCPTDLSVVSRHLATLCDAGILEAEKPGKEVYYSICYLELATTLRAMADAIESCCRR